MKCEDVESAMIDYLDKTLEKRYREEIEKHLETCERCLDELKDFQKIFQDVDSAKDIQPDETLRINFYHMLHAEMNRQAIVKNEPFVPPGILHWSSAFVKIAAGILLVVAGTFIGIYLNKNLSKEYETQEVVKLRNEVQSMKEMMMFAMLKEESSSERIRAVNYTGEIKAPDDKVLDALIKTLNNDRNVNVRLAAAYSLAKFADRKSVRDSLVASLSLQTEPILQVVLISILVDNKESNAIRPIQKILNDERTLKEVKVVARKGIDLLL